MEDLIRDVRKRFGVTAIAPGREVAEITVSPSGIAGLDAILGIAGWPLGRIIEVFGKEASGKTTLGLHAIAECQRKGGTAAFIDAEHALDIRYAKAVGVDVDKMLVSQPDSGDQALEIVDILARSGTVDIIVVDSVAALVPQSELEGCMGDVYEGLQSRLMSQACRKLCAVLGRTKTTVIFLNQVEEKVGVTFGNGEQSVAANALKFYATMRVELAKVGSITGPPTNPSDVIGSTPVRGSRNRIKVVKNKLAPPFQSIEVELVFGKGFARA